MLFVADWNCILSSLMLFGVNSSNILTVWSVCRSARSAQGMDHVWAKHNTTEIG